MKPVCLFLMIVFPSYLCGSAIPTWTRLFETKWNYSSALIKLGELGKKVELLGERLNKTENDKMSFARKLIVLDFIRDYLEVLHFLFDPIYEFTTVGQIPFVMMDKNKTGLLDIPAVFRGRKEADYKTAYVKYYRIVTNAKEGYLVHQCIHNLKNELKMEHSVATDHEIIRYMAILWCKVCDSRIFGVNDGLRVVFFKNAEEVSDAFSAHEYDKNIIEFVRALFKVNYFLK